MQQGFVRSSPTDLRVLIVGLGHRGRQWAAAIHARPGLKLVAIVDPDDQVEGKSNVPAFSEVSQAIEAAHPQLAIIASPPSRHAENVRDCVYKGVAVLCEKPLAERLDQAVEIVATADRLGVPLIAGMNFRYLPVTERYRDIVREGRFGLPLYSLFSYLRNRDGRRRDLGDYVLRAPQPVLHELAVHHVDLIRTVFDREIVEVRAHTWNPRTSVYADDSCVSAMLILDGGVVVNYVATLTSGTNRFHFEWRTDFESGVVIQRRQFDALVEARMVPGYALVGPRFPIAIEKPTRITIPRPVPFVTDTSALLNVAAKYVMNGSGNPPTGRDHLKTLAVLEALERSATTGNAIASGGIELEFGI